MIKKFLIQWSTFLFILLLTFISTHNPITSNYIEMLKHEASVPAMTSKNPLYEEIVNRKAEFEVAPIDARVDKVWKGIPGLNGLSVNEAASYDKMRKEGVFQKNKLVYDQTSPEVTLDDLPPSPIFRGNSEKPMVALMINVAWGNEFLPGMLKTLKEHDVKSTFFLDGSWVKNNPKLAKMIVEEGHEIGNHAYSHPDMKQLSNDRIREELVKTNDIISATLGLNPHWFAPPSGSFRQDVVDIASELSMHTVMWTVDTIDWQNPAPDQMARKIIDKSEPGSLVLMHPTSSAVQGLEDMIEGLKEKGLQLGTVSKTLSEERIIGKQQQTWY
ncbi:polysaccharide deacetylase family protein [Alteribacter aurantiacus]|uniref:polysaccharide deacetylase family protein n=1 Tax=Alteribacter aurantiacus TaxID=254410 RepID=UPI0004137A79|nr:polysaccharide deacetylase family protein [Alteribacter aurantiacus]